LKRILAERSVLSAFGATMLALLLLVTWTRELRPGWLAAAAIGLLIAAVHSWRASDPPGGVDASGLGRSWRRGRRPRTALLAALLLLGAGVGLGAVFSWQFQRIEQDWSGVVERRTMGLGGSLSRQMADVVDRGGETSHTAAQLAASRRTDLFRRLQVLRDQMRVDALAVYTTGGDLVAWAGEHRGPMPDSIWIRGGGAYFEERPLFSYLYFSTPVPGRAEYAVAAVLVETGIIGEGKDGAFADIVAARTRTRATFRRGGGADAVWSLASGADTVVHARLDPLSQAEWRGVLNRSARRAVLLASLGAALALAIGWLRWAGPFHSRLAASAPLLLLVPIAALAPLRGATGAERFFSPLLFTLPLPFDGDLSLGRLLALLLPVAALAAGARRREWRGRSVPLLVAAGALVLAIAYPALLGLLLDGATPALLQGNTPLWLGLQLAAVLALGLVTLLALPRAAIRTAAAGPGDGSRPSDRGGRGGIGGFGGLSDRLGTVRVRRLLLAAGVVVSAALGLAVAAGAQPDQTARLWTAALWALPFLLVAPALVPASGRGGGVARWLVVGWLASTAVLPHVWSAHLGARLTAAEGELETLGTRADPYLDYLLVTFGREAGARFAAGEEGIQLLYRTWVASGLAQEPYAARIVLWSAAGLPDVQLGAAPVLLPAEADRLTSMVDDARGHTSPLIAQFTDLPNVSRMLTVPLPDGGLITVVVPPRRSLERTSAVAPFLGAVAPSAARLNLIEATGTEPQHESMHWVETAEGWRSEAVVRYPDGWYHAHLIVPVAGVGVRMVRAALLISFNLLLLGLLWVIGVLARGGAAVPGGAWRSWLGSFRARITLALFGFFIVPTALFGWAAYSALAGEVMRSAQHLAQHAVNQAVIEFDDAGGDLRRLAAHAGSDVLRYHGGELIDVSSREALDLGVYSAWMPPHVYQRLQSGEEREALETQALGHHSFVTAYRTLPPTGTLGVPKSLSVGEAAQRLQELAHLVMFAAVLGAILSLMLSVAVGRTLAGPIGQLRRASAAVGAGTLRVRLPERDGDEFGELFTSFNRMTRRLRRARARELRTARVLAWGEMARQVAHEIKNPLTPIKLSVQHLRRAHRDRHPQFEEILDSNVTQILAEIDRLSEIARAFSRYGAPADAAGPLTAVNVPAVIRESLTLYRSGDRHVSYIDVVEPDLPLVQARTDELKEVLLNLVENSRAAIDGAGEITVRAAHVGDRVELEVADSGPGIAPELIGRIFEPHFSTRSTGTGLGLAIVRRLVESWGGTVTADSELGRGTVVRIRLLVATAPGS
jgi:signal transduction histidine kinase